ncbi:MAG: diacylglycerol kinase family protein [Clostridia bacterium]|nr:diacylglycerol kinase family protein [Clostridia bacterium]
MNTKYILYNPLAGNGKCKEDAELLESLYDNPEYISMKNIRNYRIFLEGLDASDEIILCGGDGTLNRFINDTDGIEFGNPVWYFAAGTGNDFAKDIGIGQAEPFRINDYIKNLPTVTVNGKTYRFLNGVGYGIDGYCCEVGDKLREEGKIPNYTAIAVRGLLYGYKPTGAKITVDGKTKIYRRVWIAPTMNGRYYGGGMMPSPGQNRTNPNHEVSLAVVHDAGKLRTLPVFPKIFKGTHTKHRSMIDIFTGHHITVEFDRPTPLQIDGETIRNVSRYEVTAQ